jgi:Ca2+/Na+ antiporter
MSTDNKPTVQQAAKQGSPQAIAILLNRQLQPKGITAKVSAKDSCLQIMLAAANVPNQKGLVAAIQKWIDGLGIDSIQRVQIYAKQTGQEIPVWNDSFEVIRQPEEPKIADTVISPTVATETSKNDAKVEEIDASKLDPALLELAKNGDTKAITDLIKNSLQQPDIKVRVTLNKGLLQVVLVSNQVPKQDVSVAAIPELVTGFKSTLIQKVKVVGMQETEDSNSSNMLWQQEFVIDKQLFEKTLPIRSSDFPSANSMNETQSISKVSDTAHHRIEKMVEGITFMPALVKFLNTPIGIFLSIIFAFVLANVFQVPWSVLILGYMAIAVLLIIYFKSPSGQKEMAERDKRIEKEREKERVASIAREKAREQATLELEEKRQAHQKAQEKAYKEILDIEISPLRNLQTNLAETAIEELAKVNARLTVSVILKDFPSVVAPAVFAVNQFESSIDYKVSDYLSGDIKLTCIIYQCLQECFSIKIQHTVNGWGAFSSIAGGSQAGQFIAKILPDQPRILGSYDYDQTTQALMSEASKYIGKLNEILQVIRTIYISTNSSNVKTTDPFEKIAKLKKLKDDGIITESEFESKKKNLIDRL